METQFEDFKSVNADGTTALQAQRNNGETILLARDWAYVDTTDAELKAEWEAVITTILSISVEDFEPSDRVIIPLETALNRIQTAELVDTEDDNGELRARAILEYLAECDIVEVNDDEVVLLDDLQPSESESFADFLMTAVVLQEIRETIEGIVDDLKIESPERDSEVNWGLVEDSFLAEVSLTQSQEISDYIDWLKDMETILTRFESELRAIAQQLQYRETNISDIKETQQRLEEVTSSLRDSHATFQEEKTDSKNNLDALETGDGISGREVDEDEN